eukprot:674528-Rhodomonas_salina.1
MPVKRGPQSATVTIGRALGERLRAPPAVGVSVTAPPELETGAGASGGPGLSLGLPVPVRRLPVPSWKK